MKEILFYNVSQRSFVFSKSFLFVNKEEDVNERYLFCFFVEVARAYKYCSLPIAFSSRKMMTNVNGICMVILVIQSWLNAFKTRLCSSLSYLFKHSFGLCSLLKNHITRNTTLYVERAHITNTVQYYGIPISWLRPCAKLLPSCSLERLKKLLPATIFNTMLCSSLYRILKHLKHSFGLCSL